MGTRDQNGRLHGKNGRFTEDQREETSGSRSLPAPAVGSEIEQVKARTSEMLARATADVENAEASQVVVCAFGRETEPVVSKSALSHLWAREGERDLLLSFQNHIEHESFDGNIDWALVQTAITIGQGSRGTGEFSARDGARLEGERRAFYYLADMVEEIRGAENVNWEG